MLKIKTLRQIRCYSSKIVKNVLGIESSCDDTGVAVVSTDRRILSECIYSQWSEHKRLGQPSLKHSHLTAFGGGVIPHLARQLHYDNLPLAVSECIEKATGGDWSRIDALAVTVKPGLEPCLWEGINFAKLLLKRHPRLVFIPVHHMQAHALTCRLFDRDIEFPFLTLLISGGHCLLALVSDFDKFEILGQSVDISPGNCIDKIARQLGLFELEPPTNAKNTSSGGGLVESYASNGGDPKPYQNLIEMTRNYCYKHRSCEFSFAGLVTSLHRLIDRLVQDESTVTRTIVLSSGEERKVLTNETIANVCAIMQHSIVVQLEDRLKRALAYLKLRGFDAKHVVVSGGVASNEFFRSRLTKLVENEFDMKISCPPVKYCTDNGVMIAWNGCEKLEHGSNDCIAPERQDKEFFESIKPLGKCELGHDSSSDLKLFNIKIKANK